jgi:hypothetical protein
MWMSDRVSGSPQSIKHADEEKRLIAGVPEDFRAELRRILSGGVLGGHLEALLGAIQDKDPDLRELLRYGMERLPPDDRRPDDALASYFMVLSELTDCSYELRIFATKCVEYCESDALDGWSESLPDLHAAYIALMRRDQ